MKPYAIRIGAGDVGERVTVRARTHGDPPLTDVVGWLRAWRDGRLTIERKDGSVVDVVEADVVAAKVLPPPTQRDRL